MEANPTSVELKKFSEFKAIGINRVSLGIQAFNNHDLRVMGRNHTFEDGLQALETINALFDNTTFDLILARPNQSLLQWEAELKLALSYAKNHMSIYQLMIEPGTRFYKMYQAGLLPLPAPEVIEDMYFETIKVMASHGFEHYEVSSYGRNGCVGHHNFSYWRGFDYIGIGPGAHGRVRPLATSLERCRTYRIHSPELWLRSCEELGHGLRKIEAMPPAERYKELIVLGLRTKMGVSLFEVPIRDVFNLEALLSYVNKGFLAISGGFENLTHLFPTEEGLAVIDSVLVDILKI